MRAHHDKRRPLGFILRCLQSRLDSGQIITVCHLHDMPAVRLVTRSAIFGEGNVRACRQRDTIVVVDESELAELEIDPAGDTLRETNINAVNAALQGATPWTKKLGVS